MQLLLLFFLVLFRAAAVKGLPYGWEHSVASSDYQGRYDGWVKQGYHLVYVTGFEDKAGTVRYNTIWHKTTNEDTDMQWTSSHGMTEAEYQASLEEHAAKGFRPVFVDGFSVTDSSAGRLSPRINAIYRKTGDNPGEPLWNASHGQTSAGYQSFFDQQTASGYDLDIVSTYQDNGTVRLASIFSQSTNNHKKDWVGVHDITLEQSQSVFDDLTSQGYSLDYLSAGTVQEAEPHYAAIFVKKHAPAPPDGLPFCARINVNDLQATAGNWILQDYMPKVTDAYRAADGSIQWALLFDFVYETLTPPQANGPTFSETDCFDAFIVDYMKRQHIPGANVAVLKNGKIVYSQGYGERNVPGIGGTDQQQQLQQRQSSSKVMPYTPFRTASISKPVTSLAVLRLVQEGKLRLSDKIFGPGGILQSLSDHPKPCCPIVDERMKEITVKHLLTHYGGWTDNESNIMILRATEVASTLGIPGPPDKDDYIYFMFGQRLKYDPGTTYEYSNFDFNMLARVIEQVSGKDYEQAVRELALDEIGICQEEMYSGSTQLKDIGKHEPQYYCAACPTVDSIFPTEPDKVPYVYGVPHLEAFPASSAWVASAQQLMLMLSAVVQPHCNGTIPSQNTDTCLLWTSFVDGLDGSKPAYCGPGDSSWHYDTDSPKSTWYHSGSLPGTGSLMARTEEYSFAFVANDGSYLEGVEVVMPKALQCVGDNWPLEFQMESLCSPDETSSGCHLDIITARRCISCFIAVISWFLSSVLI